MNNKKLIFTSLLTVIAIVILIVVFRLNESEKEIGYEVAKSEEKVLEIENTKITGISHNTTKNNVSTKIKNKSNKILKNISINYVELDNLIKLGFRKYIGSVEDNGYYRCLSNSKHIRRQVTRDVVQAIGRICRTYVKNKNIYIYTVEELIKKLDIRC